MATPMRSSDFRNIVEPILNESFDGIYDQRKDEWKQFMTEQTGTPRSYHEEVMLYGMGAAPELPDGQAVTYQSGGQLCVARYTYKVYGLAYALTKVLVKDGDHIRVGSTFSKHLAQSMIETKETNMANHLNRAFNGSYVGGDGVALCVNNHPDIVGGAAGAASRSNLLATAAVLSAGSAVRRQPAPHALAGAGDLLRIDLLTAPDSSAAAGRRPGPAARAPRTGGGSCTSIRKCRPR